MNQEVVSLRNSTGAGYVIPLGPVNLVWVVARKGLVGCGAFDVVGLGKFDYPAARVRPARGDMIATLEDLLSGIVRETNSAAESLGVRTGMEGKEALDLLS
jgi:uncharacterized protein YunC (DUF1805 family)